MAEKISNKSEETQRLNTDFWKFWSGQTLSNLGSFFSQFALPLLIYKLTGSAFDLGLAAALNYIPYLLFGLLIGAWADRLDRKRLMIITDLTRALVIGTIPGLAALHLLSVWWIYGIGFLNSTLMIVFTAAGSAVVPSLVEKDSLVKANGRMIASYSAASVGGPLLGGLLIAVIPIESLFIFDSLSFFISVLSLTLIRTSFNSNPTSDKQERTSLTREILEGLKYLRSQPVLLSATIMNSLINFIVITAAAQQVLFVKEQYGGSDSQVSLFFVAAGIGAVVCSLAVGRIPKGWSHGRVAIASIMIQSILVLGLGFTSWFPAGLLIRAAITGCTMIFTIQMNSLRQLLTPNQLLGRVTINVQVLAWAVTPLGALAGGAIVEATQDVVLVYKIIGALLILITFAFLFSPLNSSKQDRLQGNKDE